MSSSGKLVFFCGKMGAGKSTKAKSMAVELSAILLSEDEWLASLYPREINVFDDYIKYSARLKPLLKAHVLSILHAGVNVVLDFPGNTREQRAWFKELVAESAIAHQLVYLEVEDSVCLERIGKRRTEQPERAKFDTEAVFRQVSSYFQPPSQDEGLNILLLANR